MTSNLSQGQLLQMVQATYERLARTRGADSPSLDLARQAPHIGVGDTWCWSYLFYRQLVHLLEYCSIELSADTGEPALRIQSTTAEDVIPALVDNYIRDFAIWSMAREGLTTSAKP